VVAVPERGWKSRIVTKHHVSLLTAGHAVRELLWPALERDVRTKDVLRGKGLNTVDQAFRSPKPVRGYQILSSDLTAASDLLPAWLVNALVEGVIDGSKEMPFWVKKTMRLSTGSFELSYPDGSSTATGGPVISQRGLLMGLPLTWFFLCLAHFFWIDEATLGDPVLSNRCRVCGDDLVAHWP
jgi:hypothetical protein